MKVKAKCLQPTNAWICGVKYCKRDGVLSKNLVFKHSEALEYFSKIAVNDKHLYALMDRNMVSVPCGNCFACQIRKRKDWTTRLSHEISMHEKVCFITLTYDENHVPMTDDRLMDDPDKEITFGRKSDYHNLIPTLFPRHVQLFMKRLRRHLTYIPKKDDGRDYCPNIRYYCVGEYGSKSSRPHYHLIIFGWTPSDILWRTRIKGNDYFISAQLSKLWTYGFHTVSLIDNSNVAPYVSRYVSKKYSRIDGNDCDPWKDCCFPEFILQSVRGGGIGSTWSDKYLDESIVRGFVTFRSGDKILKASIPPYYISRFRKYHLDKWLLWRDERIKRFSDVDLEYDYDELMRFCSKELCKLHRDKEKEII